MKKRNERLIHDGKNKAERDAYNNFLHSHFSLDKTAEEAIDTGSTNNSSVEEEEEKYMPIRRKSKWLKFRDFISENIFPSIVGSLLLAAIVGAITFYSNTERDIGIAMEKIVNIEEDIVEINKNTKENMEKTNNTKTAFEVFRAEIMKDIEYLKNIIRK